MCNIITTFYSYWTTLLQDKTVPVLIVDASNKGYVKIIVIQ